MKRLLIILGMTLVTFPLCAYIYWSVECACEKEPGPHFAAWNPFRDREPERMADRFFQQLSAGQCQDQGEGEALCSRALNEYGRVKHWELDTRRAGNGNLILDYDIEYTDHNGGPTTVGFEVHPGPAGWQILRYTGSGW